MNKKGKMKDWQKAVSWLVAVIVVLAIVGVKYGYIGKAGVTPQELAVQSAQQSGQPLATSVGCAVAPAYTYSAVDKFTGASVTAVDFIKQNGNFPVTSLASPTYGSDIEYLANTTSYFCEPITSKVDCGSTQLQAQCYQNSTVSLTAWDSIANEQITSGGGANNITLSTANSIANIEYSYTTQAKRARMPFGGCLVIEYPTTVSSVTPSGAGLSTAGCPYTLTYTPATTGNTYRTFAVPAGFDADGAGATKKFSVQYQAGSSGATTGSFIHATFYPANYYKTDAGNFVLGVEKDQNQDTTKTFSAYARFTAGTD